MQAKFKLKDFGTSHTTKYGVNGKSMNAKKYEKLFLSGLVAQRNSITAIISNSMIFTQK